MKVPYAVKMPGSLSNEDEGQDDMDFEDEMPGESVKVDGISVVRMCTVPPSTLCRMRGEKGLPCDIVDLREGGGGGVIMTARLGAQPNLLARVTCNILSSVSVAQTPFSG